MPIFEVKLVFSFALGHVGNATEKVPSDLLGDDGRMIDPLACWPAEPLVLEADDDEAAITFARRQQAEAGAIWIDNRIGEVKFKELRMRPQTGSQGKFSSVHEAWITKQEGDKAWHAHYLPPGPPSAG